MCSASSEGDLQTFPVQNLSVQDAPAMLSIHRSSKFFMLNGIEFNMVNHDVFDVQHCCFSTSQARNCIFVNCALRLLCENDIVHAKWSKHTAKPIHP